MGRTAHNLKTKLIVVASLLVIGGGGTAAWQHQANSAHVHTVTNAQHQTTELSYKGKDNTDALTILKENAKVETKHYSFGDMVVSIDGTKGNGPKYWTFYINDKMSNVGAGSYKTKHSDTLSWKLQ